MSDIIKLLPDAIANQIAAGEVVQRPASVVKELLENAIDADATEIKLYIEQAGAKLIQVIDNGKGMSATDARMCFERHATSKIKQADDLFKILTFGFRGEAMASIGAVAEVSMKTKTDEQELGSLLVIKDSRVESQQPEPCQKGTSTAVKNLFFNVPARKNFLKSNKVEFQHIFTEFTRAALSNPQIAFSFYNENEVLYDLKSSSFQKRIVHLFGKNYESNLVPLEEESAIVSFSGFLASPKMAKKKRGDQYFLANGRFIKSPYFHHAINSCFEGLISADQHPAYFIKIEIEPSRLDVNVHPTKTEVKFEDERSIYALLQAATRKALNDFHMIPSMDFDQDRVNLDSWMTSGSDKSKPQEIKASPSIRADLQKNQAWMTNIPSRTVDRPKNGLWKALYEDADKQSIATQPSQSQWLKNNDLRVDSTGFQIEGKYIIAPVNGQLTIIHQNRARARVLFQKMVKKLEKENYPTQKKLFPEVIHLQVGVFKTLQSHLSQLKEMGFVLEKFGGNAFLIEGTPEGLPEIDPKNLLESLAQVFDNSENQDKKAVKLELAKSLAKSATMKSRKLLQVAEVESLIQQLFSCEEKFVSLDGKPIMRLLTADGIDQQFFS